MKIVAPDIRSVEQFAKSHEPAISWGTGHKSSSSDQDLSVDGSMWQMRVVKFEEIDSVWKSGGWKNTFYDSFGVSKVELEQVYESPLISTKPLLHTCLYLTKKMLKRRWVGSQKLHLGKSEIVLGFFRSGDIPEVNWRVSETLKGVLLPYSNLKSAAEAAFAV